MDIKPAHRNGQLAHGPWGQHTSTLDWCEDNYVHFMYIAETWNSFSNIPFILLALHGMISTLQGGLPNPARNAMTHAMIAFIGVGSFVFHATLMWHAQVLLDELPMIYTSAQALYCVLQEGLPSSSKAPKIICTLIPMLVTAIYLAYPNPLFHQVSFGALQLYLTYYLQILRNRLPENSRIKRDSTHLLVSGLIISLIAFAIWNVDNIMCDEITAWRADGGPLGVLSQGHAWWHILVAAGANRTTTAIVAITSSLKNPDSYEIAYRLGVFPYVRKSQAVKQE